MNRLLKRIEELTARLLALALGLVTLAAGLLFSAILVAVMIVAAGAALFYVWRTIRRSRHGKSVIDVESRELNPGKLPK